jgi:DNA ligase-1
MFTPMLSANLDIDNAKAVACLKWPLLVSPKLDGIRCTIQNGVAYSRNGKPIRNKHVQSILGHDKYNGLDGELIVGDPTDPNCFQISAAVMSFDQVPDFKFYVFDWFCPTVMHFEDRLVNAYLAAGQDPHIKYVEHLYCKNMQELLECEAAWVEAGFEGLMARDPWGMYLQRRSKLNAQECNLMKVKRFFDAEFEVVGQTEEIDKHGNPKGTTGALILKIGDRTFHCGGGFTKEQRAEFWQQNLNGKMAKIKYFGGYSGGAPRFPSFIAFRHEDDA